MNRRRMLQLGGAGLMTAADPGGAAQLGAVDRPNVLFVLTDDQRWDSMSITGHPFARTPNLDRLAQEGARFANAFVTTSLCSPSRASFLTGQYAHYHGVRDNFGDVRPSTPTFPTVFEAVGYDTAYFGKWHMGYDRDDPRPGFQHWVSFKGQGSYQDPEFNINGTRKSVEGYTTDLLSRYTADWVAKPRDNPFLAALSHKAVHTPIDPPERHKALYTNARFPLPETYDDPYENKPAWLSARRKSRTGVDGGLNRYGSLAEFVRRTYRTLAAVDDGLGWILEALEESGQLNRTIVIFAGDNGFFHGEHGLINKRAMYEDSIRIPFLVRYPPLIKPRTIVDQMTLNIDLAPSLLDLAGLTPPKGMEMQGRSWLRCLTGDRAPLRESWLYEYFYEPRFAPTPAMQGVRTDRWKYIRYPDIDDRDELYDLENNRLEMRNLAAESAAAGTLERMRAELFRLLRVTRAA